jgi:hypothetical protein
MDYMASGEAPKYGCSTQTISHIQLLQHFMHFQTALKLSFHNLFPWRMAWECKFEFNNELQSFVVFGRHVALHISPNLDAVSLQILNNRVKYCSILQRGSGVMARTDAGRTTP